MTDELDEPTPVKVEPSVPIRVIREQLEAQQKTLANELEQARSMVEEGQRLIQQGDTGIKQISGAKIAVAKQLADLDAYTKATE